MRFLPVVALTLAFGLLTACADEKKVPPAADGKSADTPSAAFAAIKTEFEAANEKMGARFKAAGTVEAKKAIREEAKGLYGTFAGKMLALAEAHPADPVAADALAFAATRQLALGVTGPDVDKVAELLVTKYAASPQTKQVLALAKGVGDQGAAFLKAAAAKATAPDLKGLALLALGSTLAEQAADADDAKTAADLNAQAERYLDEAIKVAPDAATDDGGTVKKAAEGELFVIRNLAVGKPAPEIAGTTLDDKKAKLSDYKGKVVLLDFWAT